MIRCRFALIVGAVLIAGSVGSVGCDSQPGTPAALNSTTPLTSAPAGSLSLLTEPDQGVQPIYALIGSAHHSIDLTMYELVDSRAETALITAARRGVDVRVVLDVNREKAANQAAFNDVRAAGVHVVWADSRYAATHQKSLVIDGDLAAIMTLNLTSRYYPSTRDFALLDRDPADVSAIAQVFNADFTHAKTPLPRGDDLVWSPGTSEPALLQLIGSARHSLLIENEEMASKPIISALVAAATRGVEVTVVMTDESDWHSAFDKLSKAGMVIDTYPANASLYIHAKVVIADAGQPNARAFIGSENFSNASLDSNRELGVLNADPAIITPTTTILKQDAAGAIRWKIS